MSLFQDYLDSLLTEEQTAANATAKATLLRPALTATQLAPPRPRPERRVQQYMGIAPPLGHDTTSRGRDPEETMGLTGWELTPVGHDTRRWEG
jgi:hypothetical protein